MSDGNLWEEYMELNVKNINDEDAMVNAMAMKVNPKVPSSPCSSWNKTPMAREFDKHPDYVLVNDKGEEVKNIKGFYAFDVSSPDISKWWLNVYIKVTKCMAAVWFLKQYQLNIYTKHQCW